jgi:hypothetical protein
MVHVLLGVYSPGCHEPIAEFTTNSFPYDPTNAAFMFEGLLDAYCTAVRDDGAVFTASRSGTDYRIVCHDSGGERSSEFSRDDIEPLEKSAEEIMRESEYMEARLASMDGAGLNCSPNPLYPMIDDIGIGPDGNLWVRRGHSSIPAFDIYDSSWNLAGTASMAIDPEVGRDWRISVQPQGILAYSENPPEGFQKVYLISVR